MKKGIIKNQTGFTLIELMITIAIGGIILGIGLPNLQDLMDKNRLIANMSEITHAFQVTRSEAIKRSARVTICSSSNGTSCNDSNDWTTGWIIFVDRNNNLTFNSDDIIQVHAPLKMNSTTFSNTYNTTYLSYISNGSMMDHNGNFAPFQLSLYHAASNTKRRIVSNSISSFFVLKT